MNLLIDKYPLTFGRVSIRKNRDNFFIYDKKIKKNLIANEDLVEILSLCNGQNSIQNIINDISEKRKYGQEQIFEKTTNVLSKLAEDKLIYFKKEKSYVPIRIREYNFRFPLNFVYLEPTRRCNFRCIHCYAMSPSITRTSKGNNEINTKKFFNLIDRFDEMGVISICLTGGELFFRRDILDILKYIDSKNIEIGILSNGSLLDKHKINEIKKLDPKFIRISFDSHKKELFEKIRGEGTYNKVIKNIEELLDYGIKTEINCVLFRGINDSYSHLREFLSFFGDRGVSPQKITFDEFAPEGEGKDKSFYLVKEKMTVKKIKKAFKKVFPNSEFVRMKETSFWNKYDGENNFNSNFCGLGEETCYINSNGDVTLCPGLSIAIYRVGNILKEDIKEVWENSEMFNYFRNKEYLKDCKCSDCKSLEKCFGGCKAKSMTFFGKFNAHDPWMCAYFDE